MENFVSQFGIIIAYILLGVATLSAIILPLINALSQPKVLMKIVGGVGILLVLFLISFAISGNEVTETYTTFGVGATASKAIGGVLTTMYLLLFGGILSIIFSEIHKIIK